MIVKVGSIVKVKHPNTVLNPTEYFEVVDMRYSTISQSCSIIGNDTCWFGVTMIEDVKDES